MQHYKELQEYLNIHQDLADKLQQPFRATQIKGHMMFSSSKLPSGGNPPKKLLSKSADWDQDWAIVDELTEDRQVELEKEPELNDPEALSVDDSSF